jgi:ribosomal protein S18 acetylase RimI-like enzyme
VQALGNWIEPAWEYMHFHPLLDPAILPKIGLWEQDGELAAVVHPEWRFGEAFFQFHPGFEYLRTEMLEYAEASLAGISKQDGRRFLMAYVNEYDLEFLALVEGRGYVLKSEETRPMYRFDIPNPFPAISLPLGFRLTSLAEEPDWAKLHRVLWRGFDNGDDVPMNEEEYESRRKMFDTPKARRDLKIAAVAPNGDFAAFSGNFYEPHGRFGYVEPVATDPAYRRMGLGKAAVLEGIRRCGELGARVAYVGSDQQFYQAIGFRKVYNSLCWVRRFD